MARASASSSSRNRGCAMPMSARARCEMDRPRISATPYSVTTMSTVFLMVVTIEPGVSTPRMRDTAPWAAVEGSTTNPRPWGEYMAPRAKSAWPPLDDQVDLGGGVDRDEGLLLGDDPRVVHVVDGQHLDGRVLVQEGIQGVGAQGERAHDLAGAQPLAGAGHDAPLDQVDQAVGQQLGVDAQVAVV